MSDDAELKLEQVRELQGIVDKLNDAKGEVRGFNVSSYEDAGGGQWAGEGRNRFTDQLETARTSYNQISTEIEQAISDVKSKQRSLAWSINALEHPIIAAQAHAIAV